MSLGKTVLASWRIPLGYVTPWEMEVLLALLGAQHCAIPSVVCFPCILSSETRRSDVCVVASLTLSGKHGDRSLVVSRGLQPDFQGDEAVLVSFWFMEHLSPPTAFWFVFFSLGNSLCF